MRKLLLCLLLLCLCGAGARAQNKLVAWDFAATNGAGSVTAQTVTSGISSTAPSGVISLGSGLLAVNNPLFYNALVASRQTATTLADAITGNDYFTFTVTPTPGYAISIDSISLRAFNQNNRSRTFALLSSKNGFSADKLIGSVSLPGAGTGLVRIPVSGHQDLTTPTEFRLYVYGYTNLYESVGLGTRDGPATGDDLVISGKALVASPTPNPALGAYESFNSNSLNNRWSAATGYGLKAENQVLNVSVNKTLWEEFSYRTPGTINISANRRVSFKVKSDAFVDIVVGVTDQNGKGNRSLYTTQLARVVPSDKFIDVSFDLSGTFINKTDNTKSVDSTRITSVMFVVDPQLEKKANLVIDDVRVGELAGNYPRLIKPFDQTVAANSPAQSLLLTGISKDATVSATSSNTVLIGNPSVTAVTNTDDYLTATGSNGQATLTYTPKTNQTGSAIITLRVSAPGKDDLLVPFRIRVNPNLAPTVDTIADRTVGVRLNKLNLSGISDGNEETEQNLTVTATSSDQSVIANSNLSVSYANNSPYGILSFTPQPVSSGSRSALITVTVTDNGGTALGGANTKTETFRVTVYNSYYAPPVITPVADNNFAYIGRTYTLPFTVSDGNGGTQISSVTLTSTNPSAVLNPTVSYTPGAATGTITYSALSGQSSLLTLTATNTGAPTNSNGNSSASVSFSVRGTDAPLTGYSEPFDNYGVNNPDPQVLGSDYYTNSLSSDIRKGWMTNFEGYTQKWFVEGQGVEQTLTINTTAKQATLAVNKPGGSNSRRFAGTWFSPRHLLDLSNNKYLSIRVSADKETTMTFDIWDVTGKRYGLLPPQTVGTTAQTFTFVFDKAPQNAGFDFSKVAAVLLNTFNMSADKDNGVTTSFTIYNLKIGDQAENAPAPQPEAIRLDTIANRTLFVNTAAYPVQLSNVYSYKDGIDQGRNITLSATSSNTGLIPNPASVAVINGQATLTLKPVAAKTGSATITVTASAAGVASKSYAFQVDVIDRSSTTADVITLDQSQQYQKMTGIGTMITDLGSAATSVADPFIGDMGASVIRIGVGVDFEPGLEAAYNDNSDPNVLDLSKFNFTSTLINRVSRAKELDPGVKIIGTIWTPPVWMKGLYGIRPQAYNTRNKLLKANYDEFAEYVLGVLLAFRNQFGFELYAIGLQNEAEFGSSVNLTSTTQYTKEEMVAVTKLVYARMGAAGLSTLIYGPETLPAQGNVLSWLQSYNNDPVARNAVGAFAYHAYAANASTPENPSDAVISSYYTEALRVEPKKELWMTETSGFTDTDASFLALSNFMFSTFASGVSMWVYYDMKSARDRIFALHKNYAKFVRPGARRIGTSSSNASVKALAFLGNGTATVVLTNATSSPRQVRLGGTTGLPGTLYAFATAKGLLCAPIDTVSSSNGYMTILPPNSVVTLSNATGAGARQSTVQDPGELHPYGQGLHLYPNPASGRVTLRVPPGNYDQITVVDLVGRVVVRQKTTPASGSTQTLNLQGLPKGMYIVSVSGENRLASKLIVE